MTSHLRTSSPHLPLPNPAPAPRGPMPLRRTSHHCVGLCRSTGRRTYPSGYASNSSTATPPTATKPPEVDLRRSFISSPIAVCTRFDCPTLPVVPRHRQRRLLRASHAPRRPPCLPKTDCRRAGHVSADFFRSELRIGLVMKNSRNIAVLRKNVKEITDRCTMPFEPFSKIRLHICSLHVCFCDNLTCHHDAASKLSSGCAPTSTCEEVPLTVFPKQHPLAVFSMRFSTRYPLDPSFCRINTPVLLRAIPHTGCAPDDPQTLDSSITRKSTLGWLHESARPGQIVDDPSLTSIAEVSSTLCTLHLSTTGLTPLVF